MNKKTIVILSGGMDSTTLLYEMLDQGKEVKVISFNYNQRHKKELEFAKLTCSKLGLEHKIINLDFMRDICSKSSLTSDQAVPEGHYEDETMKQTVVPNRNMIMASIAIGWAVNEDYDEIALGVHSGDHAIYPDCRPEFIQLLDLIAQCANFKRINVIAPFIDMDKGDIAILGKKLGVSFKDTWTCYQGEEVPCGKCGSCQERQEAMLKANIQE